MKPKSAPVRAAASSSAATHVDDNPNNIYVAVRYETFNTSTHLYCHSKLFTIHHRSQHQQYWKKLM